MSSISPSSSASNEALPLNVCSLDAVAACLAQIQVMADKGTLSAVDASSMAKQVFPAYHAGLRRCGSASPGSDLSGSGAGGGVVRTSAVSRRGSRYSALSKLKTWRAGRSVDVAGVSVQGYCYQDILSEQGKLKVEDIGPNPTVYTLLGMDVGDFLPLQKLRDATIAGSAQDAHVSFSGHGLNLCDELAAVAARSVPALRSSSTLWHRLQGLSDGRRSKFSGLTTVGALEDLRLTPQGTYVSGGRVWKAELGKAKVKIDMRTVLGCKPLREHCLSWLLRDLVECPAVFDCLQLVDEYSCYFSSTVDVSDEQFEKMCSELYDRAFVPRFVQSRYAEFEWDYGLVPGRLSGDRLAFAVLPFVERAGLGSVRELATPGLLRDFEVVSRRWTYPSFSWKFDELVCLGRERSKSIASALSSVRQRDRALMDLQSPELLTRRFAVVEAASSRVGGHNLTVSVKGGLSLLAILGVIHARVGEKGVEAVMRGFDILE